MTTVLLLWIAFLLTVITSPALVLLSFVLTGHPDLVGPLHRIAEAIRNWDQ